VIQCFIHWLCACYKFLWLNTFCHLTTHFQTSNSRAEPYNWSCFGCDLLTTVSLDMLIMLLNVWSGDFPNTVLQRNSLLGSTVRKGGRYLWTLNDRLRHSWEACIWWQPAGPIQVDLPSSCALNAHCCIFYWQKCSAC